MPVAIDRKGWTGLVEITVTSKMELWVVEVMCAKAFGEEVGTIRLQRTSRGGSLSRERGATVGSSGIAYGMGAWAYVEDGSQQDGGEGRRAGGDTRGNGRGGGAQSELSIEELLRGASARRVRKQ